MLGRCSRIDFLTEIPAVADNVASVCLLQIPRIWKKPWKSKCPERVARAPGIWSKTREDEWRPAFLRGMVHGDIQASFN